MASSVGSLIELNQAVGDQSRNRLNSGGSLHGGGLDPTDDRGNGTNGPGGEDNASNPDERQTVRKSVSFPNTADSRTRFFDPVAENILGSGGKVRRHSSIEIAWKRA